MPWWVWIAMTPLFLAFLALVVVLYRPLPKPAPRRRDAWDDVLVTYADARSRLPEHIRRDFHPDWPWLDPDDVPRLEKPRTQDDDLFEVWDLSQAREVS